MKCILRKILLPVLVAILLPLVSSGGPGEGIRLGKLTISPFANLGLTYDSNVFLMEDNELDDLFLDATLGVSATEKIRSIAFDARGWYMFRRYQTYTEKSHDEWAESLAISYGSSEKTLISLSQRFRKTEDYERTPGSVEYVNPENQTLILSEDRTMRVPRELADIGVSISHKLGEKTAVMASAAFNNNNYESSGLLDWNEGSAMASISRKVTEKTSASLSASYGLQNSDGLSGRVDFSSVDLGVAVRQSAKLHLDASGGVQFYNAPENTGPSKPAFITFNAAARWAATKKWTLQLSTRNGMQPASQVANDTMKVTLFSLSAERPIRQNWLFSVTGAYRYDLYHHTIAPGANAGPEDTGEIQNDATQGEAWSRQWAGHISLNYNPIRKPYNIYTEVRYEDTESVWFKYEQLRASIGLSVRY